LVSPPGFAQQKTGRQAEKNGLEAKLVNTRAFQEARKDLNQMQNKVMAGQPAIP
jgi:hypothetical protein